VSLVGYSLLAELLAQCPLWNIRNCQEIILS
jgi:hypothetical protein